MDKGKSHSPNDLPFSIWDTRTDRDAKEKVEKSPLLNGDSRAKGKK